MITNSYLLDKYSTGVMCIFPGCRYFADSKMRNDYHCEAAIDQIIEDYASHLMAMPIGRCIDFRMPFDGDGCLRTGGVSITEEEISWLFMEYKLRRSLCKYDGIKVKFLATKIAS